MSHTGSILRSRRVRRQSARRSTERRLQFGGLGCGMLVSLALAVVILAAALTYADLTRDLPNTGLLRILLDPRDGLLLQPTRVYDRTGQHLIFTFAPGDGPRRYLPLNPQNPQHLPDFLARATVATADPRFWKHGGWSLAGLTDPNVHPTLAQRLVAQLLLYNEPASLRRGLRERILAAQITAEYGRTQILEWYLNCADYGNYAYGIDAAAQLYFEKPAAELSPAEAAVLAAVSEAPSLNPLDARDVALKQGRKTVQAMQSLKLISGEEAAQALGQASIPNPPLPAPTSTIAPAFVNLAIHQLDSQFTRDRLERGGLDIITTLDYDLQQEASCTALAFANRLEGAPDPAGCDGLRLLPPLPPGTAVAEPSASALILDPQTGQILAAVGETLKGAETAFLAAHNPGSALQPFIYLTAFTRGLSPASLMWDIPLDDGLKNFDNRYHGPVRLRVALDNDYVAVGDRIANQMGSDALNRMRASFGLGGSEATLLDIASAYAVFAVQGVRYGQPGPVSVLRIEGLDHSVWLDWSEPQAQPILTPQLAYLMNNTLSDETARQPSLGHPNPTELGRPAAVKLGQTQDGQSVWTVGYTPRRVVVTWTSTHAADSPRLSPRLSAGLWNALTSLASESLPPDGWSVPPGVSVMDVCDPSGLLPTRDCPSIVSEVFLNGNEPVQPDNLYRTYQINRETGYLATVFTPPQLVEDRVFMAVPPEAQAWAKTADLPAAPTSYDAIQSPQVNPDMHITAPQMFAEVDGVVQIIGTAAGADFDHYRVLVGKGLNPQEWIQVGGDSSTPVNEGVLATWDTSGLDGLYAVQLQVIRTDQRLDSAMLQVTVKNK